MKLNIAILGNSHLSPILSAWRQIGADFPAFNPTFFAAPGWNFRRLQIGPDKQFGILDSNLFGPEEIRLLKNTFDRTSIDLNAFDAVLHVGHDTLEFDFVEMVTGFSIDGLYRNNTQPILSYDAYESFTRALADAAVLSENWRDWKTPRLYVLPAPRVAESCAETTSTKYAAWRHLLAGIDADVAAGMLTHYADCVTESFAAHNIRVLFPPKTEVLTSSGLAKSEFAKGALRMIDVQEYPPGDHKYMNADYGQIALRHILETMQKDFWAPSTIPKPVTNAPAEPTIVFRRRANST